MHCIRGSTAEACTAAAAEAGSLDKRFPPFHTGVHCRSVLVVGDPQNKQHSASGYGVTLQTRGRAKRRALLRIVFEAHQSQKNQIETKPELKHFNRDLVHSASYWRRVLKPGAKRNASRPLILRYIADTCCRRAGSAPPPKIHLRLGICSYISNTIWYISNTTWYI